MGVPRLTRLLRPYATESQSLRGTSVVVDGPAFCYHAYHICLSARWKARNQFEAAISYAEVGRVAIAWLDALRLSGVSIRHIYFDGYLPASKYETRISRIVKHTDKLLSYHTAYPITPYSAAPAHQDGNFVEVIGRHSVPDRLTKLPPVPFLVPAILECLKTSVAYKDITKVVPGEADVYCAESIRDATGIVLTGDSDLLVHNIGRESSVLFFGDIERDTDDQLEGLRALVYCPTRIATRLGLPDLYALAFELTSDITVSFPQLLERAKSLATSVGSSDKYEDFQNEYVGMTSPMPRDESGILGVLFSMDPRISEYVLQFPYIAKIAGYDLQFDSASTSHVFLPFLFDNPIRTNAWEISRSVRQLAYGLVNLVVPAGESKCTVFEHKRQQSKSGGRELQILDPSKLLDACEALLTILNEMSAKLPDCSQEEIWQAVGVYQDVDWHISNSKEVLGSLVRHQVLMLEDKQNQNLSWDILQYSAQLDGSYYSFRILKQITLLTTSLKPDLPPLILTLNQRLQSLPPIEVVKSFSHIVPTIKMIKQKGMAKVAHEVFGVALVEVSAKPQMSRRDAKRKRKADRAHSGLANSDQKASNPFDVLSIE
ncbi:XPG domain containing-domain-containing protein [Amylocarpus encephaloides]|uniref:XPG domain containing-domain-containing protein n=1 Tax=Amylocarpus encephaloides TaxID=45428 RepID=A0A9P7YR80_9HELO|nr:XPG domain containing-domain-containing protein [Amylocarpus encephaloides]